MNPKVRMEKIINGSYKNIGALMVQKQGQIVYEKYYHQYSEASYFHVFSVTKSIISLLIGMAVDEGLLQLEQKILEFFPDYEIKRGETTIQEITVKNLLTMTAPYRKKKEDYNAYFSSDDWVKASLDALGGKDQIGTFRYSPLIGPDILSAILVKVTGKTVLEYAAEKLFKPLGIEVNQNITFESAKQQLDWYKEDKIDGWVAGPTGIHTAGWGLCLKTRDMVKLGELVLKDGKWEGKQIISEYWINELKTIHSKWEEWGYSYLWWILDEKQPIYAALGDGGNVIYINEEKALVVAISGLFQPKVADSIKLIREYIEPIFS